MSHAHSVVDTDKHFIIDGKTRAVTNKTEVKTSIFQYDHNSERFTFEMPRLIDGHDMTKCDIIQIHYINVDGKTRHSFADVYEVTDAQASPDNPDVMTCSWLISNHATQYVGSLNFVIRFVCYDTNGDPSYVWSTAVHTDVRVESSINNGEAIVIDYSDVLIQWEERLFGIGDTVEQQMRDSADEKLAEFDETAAEYLARVDTAKIDASIAMKGDNLYFDEESKLLYLTSNGNIIGDGIAVSTGGGGGGGGSISNASMSIKNTSGWTYKTISEGAECPVSFTWSSIEEGMETGPGALQITVNKVVKYQTSVTQGSHTIDISKYLGAGSNTVAFTVSDIYGTPRSIIVTVNTVALSLSSQFDGTAVQTGAFQYFYTPVGAVTKTVHFVMDGKPIGNSTVSTSGRQQTFDVPAQSHGAHTFEVYFTADINGATVPSNSLKYKIICTEAGNNTPIITFELWNTDVEQFGNISIPWRVHVPNSMTADVVLSAPDLSEDKPLTVDRTVQTWAYRPDTAGSQELKITCGRKSETLTLTVVESKIDVEAETQNMSLYLSSYGRSNNESEPGVWTSGDISAEFTNFNFVSDGWINDEDGITALRVTGDARLEIPLKLFKEDFRGTGKTIEIEFATRNILNYDAVIMSCWSNDRGLKLTAQRAMLTSEQSSISTQYKEDEHVRLTFVVQKSSDYRLMTVYINGIMSGVIQYDANDDFSQSNPVNISVGSSDCTIDLYTIRVYDNDLTRFQVVDNWISDTQIASVKNERWKHNNVFDDYGQIVIAKLPTDLPYMIINAAELPQYKLDDYFIVASGEYVDPSDSSKNFTFENAEVEVQGTSSAEYARKNYKIKFKGGFVQNGETKPTYQLGDNNIPTDTFTFKADVASSEGANNVELVKLYNDTCPYKTPAQLENSSVRQGIDGYPMVIFHNNGTETIFIGKYNFNHDKGTPEVFGLNADDESWEIRNNTSTRVTWKNDDFSGTDWQNDFEARHPKKNTNTANLAALSSWIKSTDRSAVDTEEEKSARLAKFKNELGDWMDVDSTLFYYLFTELFLMVDNRAKNAFPTRYDNGKWCWLPYDMDTAIGINNEGSLVFGYELEDIDKTSTGANVYNGSDSVLWNNVRDAFPEELMKMYQTLRKDGVEQKWSYSDTESRFANHQAKWPVALFNEDAYYKYLEPLFVDNTASYLGMLQGSKAEQRKWWLYNRFRYIDSKYNAGDALKDVITLRGYAKSDLSVTPYADIYASIKYGSYLVQKRALRKTGSSCVLECPLDYVDDTETYIYSASQLAEITGIDRYHVGFADFSKGTKLQSLKLGDASPEYSNKNLIELYLGNNTLLKTLDVRNCPNLGIGANEEGKVMSTVDLSGCTNIEHIYFDGTSIKGVNLPNGGNIKTLHLPGTVTSLIVCNHSGITDFSMPLIINEATGCCSITTLRLENVSSVIPMDDILNKLPTGSRVRLIGFDWSFDSIDDALAFCDRLDTMRGLDEKGENVDKPQMSGTIRVDSLTGAQLASIQSRYPDIKVVYQHITSYLYIYNEDGSSVLQIVAIQDGADGSYTGSTPTKASTAQYTYTFAGWSLTPGGEVDEDALKAVAADRSVYAAFTATLRKYTVYWKNGSTTLETDTNVPYGTVPTYNGSTPVYTGENADDYAFNGWTPAVKAIIGDTTYTAQFKYTGYVSVQLIEKSISGDYENRTATAVGNYAFKDCDSLTSVYFQAATSVGAGAFENCGALKKAAFVKQISIGSSAFMNSKLDTLLLHSETMCSLSQSNALDGTPIANGTGYIYVPAALIDSYKADGIWSNYANQFRTFEDYPEMMDKYSWNTVFTSIDDGTYATKYAIGDAIPLDLGSEGLINMQIAAFDTDDLADGSGKAPVTFIAKEYLKTTKRMNPSLESSSGAYTEGTGSVGGWEKCEMRAYLKETIKPLIATNVASRIAVVTKTHRASDAASNLVTQSTKEDVWIPSETELTSTYTALFPDQMSRYRYCVGNQSSASQWWTRDAYTSSNAFIYVNYGILKGSTVTSGYGVVLSFCVK